MTQPNYILLVDDSKTARTIYARVLGKKFGLEVMTAENGAQALHLLRQEPGGLYVVDHEMPDINGIELIRQFHENGFNDKSRIVGMSGTDFGRQFLEARAHGFFMKEGSNHEQLGVVADAAMRLET